MNEDRMILGIEVNTSKTLETAMNGKKEVLKSIPSIPFDREPPAFPRGIEVNTFFNFLFFYLLSQEWESNGVYTPSSSQVGQFLAKF